jgi:Type I phosphodiesterase / nucleotide pyrophosphatase
MRYLRMLSNSIIAGAVAAAYLALLVLQLNPHLSLRATSTWWLAATILAGYGIHLAAIFYAIIVFRQLLTTESLSPGWFSVQLLASLCAGASMAAAVLMWLNLRGFRVALDDEAAQRMTIGASAMTACAVAFVLLAIVRYSVGRRGASTGGLVAATLVALSLGLPLAARGVGEPPLPAARRSTTPIPVVEPSPGSRVWLIGIDGASLDIISPAAADGRLPSFGRLLDGGASLHLATLRPTQPAPVWTAVATGKLPAKNGIRSAAMYTATAGGGSIDLLPDFCLARAMVSAGLFAETTQTAVAVRAAPVWSVLSRAGVSSTIVRWPLTWPAQPLLGTLVSDQYHRASDVSLALDEPGLTFPTELVLQLRARPQRPVLTGPPAPPSVPGDDYPAGAPLALDRAYASIADWLASERPSTFFALRLQGLDTVSHYFLRHALPRAFGDVSEEERRQYGQVLDQYYRYVDGEIGRVIDRMRPSDLLLVVSPFGMQPLSPAKRLLEHSLGNASLSGSHERAPDGFLLAYGAHVNRGRLPRGSVVDVTPTILYFLDLPVGRDMDGFARADIFSREFTAERPIAFIPTYER